AGNLDALAVRAVSDLDGVARAGGVDRLLDAVEARVLSNCQRVMRALRRALHLTGVGRRGVVDRKRRACGGERARDGEPEAYRELHLESLSFRMGPPGTNRPCRSPGG